MNILENLFELTQGQNLDIGFTYFEELKQWHCLVTEPNHKLKNVWFEAYGDTREEALKTALELGKNEMDLDKYNF